MQYSIYVVDAFAARQFSGNPAAVVLLDNYLADNVLQAIAAENNLAETAYPVRRADGKWDLRWFTPGVEVPLCGHATLASAFVLFTHVIPDSQEIVFVTRRSGELLVRRNHNGSLTMDFPANPTTSCDLNLSAVFAQKPTEVRMNSRQIMAVLDSPEMVRECVPSIAAILDLPHNLIITAPGDNGYDCVSRFFAPHSAIDEDPVTGGAHCAIAPYWAQRLGKTEIRAWQASARGGELLCRVSEDRVFLRGYCVPYLSGRIEIL